MKKIFGILMILLMVLSGCTNKLHFDKEFGISYYLNDENSITIRLDTKNPDRITSISISVNNDLRKDGLSSSEYPNDLRTSDEKPVTYFSNENFEYIRVNLYMDDFKESEVKALSDYLNHPITKEMSLRKFLNSDTFVYRELFEKGTVLDDISFVGFGHKVDEKYYK